MPPPPPPLLPPVLVVEDEDAIRQVLREALEDAGYVVYEAADGRPALARLQESHEQLVVLVDLHMPCMDGRQVLEAVAAHETLGARHAYVLMTAAYTTIPLALVRLLTHLHVPTLPKPFDLDDLLGLVSEAAARLT